MTDEEASRVFDAAQKAKCDREAADVDDHWNPFGGSCWCADPNQPVVIAGLLAVAQESARRALTAALRAVEAAEGHLCDAYWDVEKLLLAAGGTVPNWDEEDAR